MNKQPKNMDKQPQRHQKLLTPEGFKQLHREMRMPPEEAFRQLWKESIIVYERCIYSDFEAFAKDSTFSE